MIRLGFNEFLGFRLRLRVGLSSYEVSGFRVRGLGFRV